MKIHTCTQGSVEWFKLRAGIPTASEFHRLVSPKWKIRTGDGPHTFMCEKLAEKWTGMPLPQMQGFGALEQGTIIEEEARPYFELTTGREIQQVGFITTDDGRIGCSPDGIFADGGGIEIKAPQAHTHVGYLLENAVPEDYLAQVHGSMLVTGAQSWEFLSYRRNFPPLHVTVRRDEQIQTILREALELHLAAFDAAYEKLAATEGSTPAGK